MSFCLNNPKLNFFYELHVDDYVLELGAEKKIRSLTEEILLYTNQAKNYYYKSNRNGGILADDYDSITYDFCDLADIVYDLGTCDAYGFFKNLFNHPLDFRLNDVYENYINMVEGNTFELDNFDGDVSDSIEFLSTQSGKKDKIHLEKILVGALDLLIASQEMVRLGGCSEIIKSGYKLDFEDSLSRIKSGDFSFFTSMWGEEKKFTNRRLNFWKSCFARQSAINMLNFKALYFSYNLFLGRENCVGIVEEALDVSLSSFEKNYRIDVNIDDFR